MSATPTLDCFHCHQSVPENFQQTIFWNNTTQHFCCAGCFAVAEAIIHNGLDDYYKFRTEVSVKPDDLIPQELRDIQLMDDQVIQKNFVVKNKHQCKAELGVEGITCAACSWLIENSLLKIAGIEQVMVNPVTHRMKVIWDDTQIQLSDIIKRLHTLGYKAFPFQQNSLETSIRKENKRFLIRLGIAGLGMMQVMMFALGVYIGDEQGIDQAHQTFLHWVSGLVATPIVFYSAFPFFKNAWLGLKAKHLVMDVPVVIAVSLAYGASVWATLTHSGQVYFDSVSMFIFFLLSGRYLEHRVRMQSIIKAQTQRQVLPLAVTRLTSPEKEDNFQDVPLHHIVKDDYLLIRAGETIAVDGIVVKGQTHVNESMITGETKPQFKQLDDHLLAGTINESQSIVLKATAVGENTYLSALDNMTQNAAEHKPVIAQIADKIAHYFVAAILSIVALVYIAWLQFDADSAFWIALSVLVVSCPCALSLATPTALTVASQKLGQLGLLVLKPHTLHSLSQITCAAFDKTGTLTQGEMKIVEWQEARQLDKESTLQVACALERHQLHPIAKAFHSVDKSTSNSLSLNEPDIQLSNITQHLGYGVSGMIDEREFRIGKLSFVTGDNTLLPERWQASNPQLTPVYLSCNQQLIACFWLSDPIKQDSQQLIEELHQQNITTAMISGDQQARVDQLQQQLNICEAKGNLLPQDKAAFIAEKQNQKHRVLMVGDGLNDNVVLAQADVGIAIDTAADITQLNADAVLTNKKLITISHAVILAKKTQRNIKQNLTWALAYNVCAIPLAALGWVPPWLAAIGMTTSSLVVVLNALRLGRNK